MSYTVKKFVAVVTLILITQGCKMYSENFYVQNATLVELERHKENIEKMGVQKDYQIENRMLVVSGHRITKGHGSVIAIRIFHKGSIFYTDKANFEKITIYIPVLLQGSKGEINFQNEKEGIIFYSRGNSSFPGRSGCFGYAKEGKIKFEKLPSEDMNVAVFLRADLKSPANWEEDCTTLVLERSFTLKLRNVSELTPWEGKIGSNLMDETFPAQRGRLD